ncbi:Meiotic expression up-regulated protein 10 [Smittium mucronatum]|uniref:Meiotic expression up-regulated protein 10 n=1 Tax=Smittium mucronatum TaxID=133383 RepID=A0A1R0H744_9FUNG|nr:Meiotic expression up-regulated protein 10 [Smittium mucronatum]
MGQVKYLNECPRFSGNINIVSVFGDVIDLSNITEINGSLTISSSSLQKSIYLNSVTSISGDLVITNNNLLQSIDLSNLLTVGGAFDVSGNFDLNSLKVQNLEETQFFRLSESAIVSINIPNLKQISSLEIKGNTVAGTISFPSLSRINGDLTINNNNNAIAQLSKLESVNGQFNIRGLGEIQIDSLTSIKSSFNIVGNSFQKLSAPVLVSSNWDISISGNKMLESLSLPNLETVGNNLSILGNPFLSSIGTDSFASLNQVSGNSFLSSQFDTLEFNKKLRFGGSLRVEASPKFNCKYFVTLISPQVASTVTCKNS